MRSAGAEGGCAVVQGPVGGNEPAMARLATPPPRIGLLVIQPLRRRHCAECSAGPLSLLVIEEGAPRCLDCADLGHLVFLPRGDTALTRRSREESGLSAVVVRFNRRKGAVRAAGRPRRGGGARPGRGAVPRGRGGAAAAPGAGRRRRAAEDVRFTEAFAAEIRRLFPGVPGGAGPGDRRARVGAGQRAGGPECRGAGAVRGGGGLGGRGVRTACGHAVRPAADERGAAARGPAADRRGGGDGAAGVAVGQGGRPVDGQGPGGERRAGRARTAGRGGARLDARICARAPSAWSPGPYGNSLVVTGGAGRGLGLDTAELTLK